MIIEVKMIEIKEAQGGERNINNPEAWKEICEEIEGRKGIWQFETNEKKLIKDYFVGDFDIHDWLDDEAKDAEVILTIHVDEEHKAAEYALGTWGDDLDYGIENREYQEDDYEGVIEWLNKIAQEEEE